MFRSIASKLLACIAALALCLLVVAGDGWVSLRLMEQKIQTIVTGPAAHMPQLKVVSDMYAVNIVDAAWKTQSGQMSWDEAVRSVETAASLIAANWRTFSQSTLTDEEKPLAVEAAQMMTVADAAVTQLESILRRRDETALTTFTAREMYAAIDPVTGKVSDLVNLQLRLAQSDGATAQRAAALATVLMSLVILGAVAVLLFTLRMVVRGVTQPLRAMTDAMRSMAEGDLSVAVPHGARKDEIGAMASALSVFKENGLRVRALEEQERAAAAARLARAQSMEAVVSDVGEVVAAAAAGDFSARLQIDHSDEQMQKLVSGINQINAVVDGATSDFSSALQAIAAGDLTHQVETTYLGRFADLKTAINDTVERLSSTVKTIQLTSVDVGLAAREINKGADDLSKRTEQQASSLEETAATTEELAASVKATAQASRQAATVADDAMQAAQTGGAIAGQAVEAMARIEDASQKISDTIRVIDDIAFQTNLLALNAAVESARAGDAGKGFAVVASEVRTLAQRSSEAAKDIAALISSSNTEVGDGVKLVRRAGDQLSKILASSQKVAATIADISAATGEQANGIDAMSQAVAQLDEMTQANAALAEESAASATSLTGRIVQLNDLVAAFKTGQDGARAAGHAVPRIAATEPVRLRLLAQAALTTKAPAHRMAAPALRTAAAAPARKVASSRAGDSGWEEF